MTLHFVLLLVLLVTVQAYNLLYNIAMARDLATKTSKGKKDFDQKQDHQLKVEARPGFRTAPLPKKAEFEGDSTNTAFNAARAASGAKGFDDIIGDADGFDRPKTINKGNFKKKKSKYGTKSKVRSK